MRLIRKALPILGRLLGSRKPQEQLRLKLERSQGIALETLGHAVEYLEDEQGIFAWPSAEDYRSAIRILCRASRHVYEQRGLPGV